MYFAFNAPHDPRQSPKRFVEMYDRQSLALPASFLPEYPYKQEIGCYRVSQNPGVNGLQRDEKLAPWPRTEFAVKAHRQEYYAAVTHVDEQIGRILAALDSTGERENTYIFFTSDHGLACGRHGLLGKQNMYEHSMKPPLIVVGPWRSRRRAAHQADLHARHSPDDRSTWPPPSAPKTWEFESIMPLVRDRAAQRRSNVIYGCYEASLQRMIRVGEYKLIVYPRAKVVRLFNLRADPEEMIDLASEPDQQDRVANLVGRLIEEQQRLGDAPRFIELPRRICCAVVCFWARCLQIIRRS